MFERLINISLIFVFIVIGLGALTRLLDAGLGCPDWPGCYGQLIPPDTTEALEQAEALFPQAPVIEHQAWMEMIHRYAAGSLGILVLALTWIAFQTQKPPLLKKLTITLCIVVVTQALFGMWTVTLKLWPPVVTLHLLGGFTTLCLLIALKSLNTSYIKASKPSQNAVSFSTSGSFPKVSGVAALFLLVLQITLGAWTSSNYAGLACPDFPTCQNQWLPDVSINKAFELPNYDDESYLHGRSDAQTRVSIQYFHRLGALLTTIALLFFTYQLLKQSPTSNRSKAYGLLVLLFTQIILGILSAVLLLPLSVALGHNLVAASLLAMLVWILTSNLIHGVHHKEIEHGLIYHN